MKRVRHNPSVRQVVDVETLARRLAGYEAAAQQTSLTPTDRLQLQAYIRLEAEHGAKVGRPGVSWATDDEVARYVGRTVSTVRRGRYELAQPSSGEPPFISVEYVGSFHKLPNGEMTLHGANVVTVLGMVPSTSNGDNPASEEPQRGIRLPFSFSSAQVLPSLLWAA